MIYESLGVDRNQGVTKHIFTLALSIPQTNAVLQYSKLRKCPSLKDSFFLFDSLGRYCALQLT